MLQTTLQIPRIENNEDREQRERERSGKKGSGKYH